MSALNHLRRLTEYAPASTVVVNLPAKPTEYDIARKARDPGHNYLTVFERRLRFKGIHYVAKPRRPQDEVPFYQLTFKDEASAVDWLANDYGASQVEIARILGHSS